MAALPTARAEAQGPHPYSGADENAPLVDEIRDDESFWTAVFATQFSSMKNLKPKSQEPMANYHHHY
jgi:hypothetical protein